jgi:hypothetical protein
MYQWSKWIQSNSEFICIIGVNEFIIHNVYVPIAGVTICGNMAYHKDGRNQWSSIEFRSLRDGGKDKWKQRWGTINGKKSWRTINEQKSWRKKHRKMSCWTTIGKNKWLTNNGKKSPRMIKGNIEALSSSARSWFWVSNSSYDSRLTTKQSLSHWS